MLVHHFNRLNNVSGLRNETSLVSKVLVGGWVLYHFYACASFQCALITIDTRLYFITTQCKKAALQFISNFFILIFLTVFKVKVSYETVATHSMVL